MDDEIVRLEENMAQLNTADQFIQPANTSIPSILSLPTTSAAAAAVTSTTAQNNNDCDRLPFDELKSKKNTENNTSAHTKILVIRKKGIYLLMERLSRILLFLLVPLTLLLCILLKINFMSLSYLFLLLFLPFFYPINSNTIANRLKKYLITVIATSTLHLLGHFIFQIVLLSNQPYANKNILPNCSFKQEILEEFGFSRWDIAYLIDVFRIIIPDVLITSVGIFTLVICVKINKKNQEIKLKLLNDSRTRDVTTTFTDNCFTCQNSSSETDPTHLNHSRSSLAYETKPSSASSFSRRILPFELKQIVKFISEATFLIFLFLCSSLWPSVASLVYLLMFLYMMTKWSLVVDTVSLNKLEKKERILKLILIVYLALHILVCYLYQFYLFQSFIPPESLTARLLGLSKIIFTRCEQPAHYFISDDFKWQQITYPFVLLFLYWFLAVEFSYKKYHKTHEDMSFKSQLTEIKHNENQNEDTDTEEAKGTSEKRHLFATERSKTVSRERLNSEYIEPENGDTKKSINKKKPSSNEPQKNTYLNVNLIKLLIKFLEKQSYLLSLIAMMAWSILYHSILTFVLLLWACLIWVLPKSRKWCLKTSPLFVAYSIGLICLEFIYGLQLTKSEMPDYAEIGLVTHSIPFFDLTKKVGLTLTFWLTLRQYIAERLDRTSPQQSTSQTMRRSEAIFGSTSSNRINSKIINWIYLCLVKYWIYLSSGMLLLMSCQSPVVAYRIGYMILFLYFVTTFQIMYQFWRKTLYIFHLIVIIYSMIVLLLLYAFQFKIVPVYIKKWFHIDDEVLSSIGFEFFAQKEQLVVRLLTPTTFLIVNILQIHYFNDIWLKITDNDLVNISHLMETSAIETNQVNATITSGTQNEKKDKEEFSVFLRRILLKADKVYCRVAVYLWRAAEIHIYKCVIVIIGIYCLHEVNFLNSALFFILLTSLLIERIKSSVKRVRSVYSGIFQVWISSLTICSMIYNMTFIKFPLTYNCSSLSNSSASIDPFLFQPHNITDYIGIQKYDDSKSILENLQFHIFILLFLTLRKIIQIKTKRYRKRHQLNEPLYSTVFEHITFKDIDVNCKRFIQYMINYFFYRYGLEICFFMSAITIAVRMDAYAILYGCWLGLFVRMRRDKICRLWSFYFVFLLIVMAIEYAFCLGVPPFLCFNYPWYSTADFKKSLYLFRIWLYLPNYNPSPVSYRLVADFFQIYFAWLQYAVFQIESKSDSQIVENAGTNKEIVHDSNLYKAANPYHDFVSTYRNNFDKIKYGVFMYSYWLVLAMVFVTGTSRISVLCLGYVVSSFFFFWYGQNFLIKPIEKLLKLWNAIVFYCFVVIFIKACLQIILCLLTDKIDPAIINVLIDIFGINCRTVPSKNPVNDRSDDVGLVWDVACFIVLLIQRRIYSCYMFQYVVHENKAQSTLAARGAQIFKDIIQMRVKKEKIKYNKEMKILKDRVTRIRDKRAKLNERSKGKNQDTNDNYYNAIRSGGYYMFETEFETSDSEKSDTELEREKLIKKNKSSLTSTDLTDAPRSSAFNSDIDTITLTTNESNSIIKTKIQTINIINETKMLNQQEIYDETVAYKPFHVIQPTNEELPEDTSEDDKRDSWLTIKNQTALNLISYLKEKGFFLTDLVIDFFNRHSKDFRIVSHILSKEKLILKKDYGNTQTPGLMGVILNSKTKRDEYQHKKPTLYERLEHEESNKIIKDSSDEIEANFNKKSRLDKILSAVFYLMLSQSELICYFFMIISHLTSASLLSIPLPVSIFLWAMLCIPRPTKTYWITIITYVEVIVVVKYIFQFKFFAWNRKDEQNLPTNSLSNWLQLLGIDSVQKDIQFAIYDLFVLLSVFFHRIILKKMGLWRDSSVDDDDLVASNEETNNDPVKRRKIESDQELNDSTSVSSNEYEIEEIPTKRSQKSEGRLAISPSDQDDNPVNKSDSEEKKRKKQTNKSQFACIRFYQELNTKCYAVVVDCYAKMFLCDFINCIITIFTYQYFWESASMVAENSNVVNSIKDNKVPYAFLMMFLIQFLLMIIDRALYLRKNRQGKFIFQLLLVVSIHVWIFFVLPFVTKLRFINNPGVQIWYAVKCVYFAFSSRQLRCGYPKRILGNFLTKSYSYVNMILFKGFLIIPFLLEIRSLMDWMFTDSSFGLFDWLQMEDIYTNIFVLKCNRHNEKEYPTQRGAKRKAFTKYSFGGFMLIIIILIIWFPLLLFSVSSGFNRSVPPTSCKINVQLAGFLPIYSMTSQLRLNNSFKKSDLDELRTKFKDAYSFLEDFNEGDVYCVSISGNSTSLWEISPPSLRDLKQQLNSSDKMSLDFMYSITRESSEEKNEQLSETVNGVKQKELENDIKSAILSMLNKNSSHIEENSISIHSIYPRFVHARSKGSIIEIDSFKGPKFLNEYYMNATFSFKNISNEMWWNVYDDIPNYPSIPSYKPPCFKQGNLNLVIFSDKVFPSSLTFITEKGIIGIYITFVLAISRFIRIMAVNSSIRIMFEQLPNVDRILKLCDSLYMVRENKKFDLEEEIYAKIIFLYRSPETMIKYTKNKSINKKTQ